VESQIHLNAILACLKPCGSGAQNAAEANDRYIPIGTFREHIIRKSRWEDLPEGLFCPIKEIASRAVVADLRERIQRLEGVRAARLWF
jgi:hypothetical protein